MVALLGGANNETLIEEINCIDVVNHNTVKYGEFYFSDNCLMCKCGFSEFPCQNIWCPPPTHCNGVVTKDPRHCCDICSPPVLIGGPIDHAGPSLKLGGMTITFLILVSIIFFMLHRLKKKRLLITVRRCRSFDDVDLHPYLNSTNPQCGLCPNGSTFPFSRANVPYSPSRTYAGPPPSYFTAIRGGSNHPVGVTVYTVPPPPYLSVARGSECLLSDTNAVPTTAHPSGQGCRSWPDLLMCKLTKRPLKRKSSHEMLNLNTNYPARWSVSDADARSLSSSTCSSSSCSSGCDCRSCSSDDQDSIYFVPTAETTSGLSPRQPVVVRCPQ